MQIAVPARGELLLSNKAVGQVMGSNHSEVAQVWSYFDAGLAFCSLLVAALKGPHSRKKIGLKGGPGHLGGCFEGTLSLGWPSLAGFQIPCLE